jgi:DNA polymerase-1
VVALKDARRLFYEGSLALAEVEANGVRVDEARLDRSIRKVEERIARLDAKLRDDDIYKTWLSVYKSKTKLSSRLQLGRVLFDELGYPSTGTLEKSKRHKTDEDALIYLQKVVEVPFVDRLLQSEKLRKALSTYLKGIKRELVNGFFHASYSLNIPVSYRSSCSMPNFQNFPIRDPEIGKLIRKCIIARDGHVIIELDYGALEFKVAACKWLDENMIAYASDPTRDIHRDMAAECYRLPEDKVPKSARFYAKNQLVFPILYGSYYISCARNLWKVIDQHDLETEDGIGLKTHLKRQGIKRVGNLDPNEKPQRRTFERHIQKVEESFNGKFPHWSEAKEEWLAEYLKTGWFDLMTGFRARGVFTKNQIYNIPVQGPAFHCLLWALIDLQKRLKRRRMGAKIIGQIHDSIVADVPIKEVGRFLRLAKETMSKRIRRAWKWIIVPLLVEAEVCPEGGSWFDKKEVEI